MKNKMIIFSLVFLLFLIPLMNATESYIFKQDVESTLEIPVFNNDLTKCLTCSCEITINYPNGTNAVRSDTTTLVNNYISYPLSGKFVSVLGTYKSDIYCTNGADYGISTFEYNVNGIGSPLSSSQSILYFILLGGILIVLGFTTWGAIVYPWKNPRDENGGLISINDLKYVKVILWIFVYLEVLFAVSILKNLSGGYLAMEGTYSFFNIAYNFLLIGLLPFFPVLIFITIVTWLNDKKTIKNISRGLPE